MAMLEGVELGAGGNCCKKMLFVFNVLFLVTGLMAIALGLFIAVFPLSQHIAVLVGSNLYNVAAYILIMAGIAVCVVAFAGCCGAKYENKVLLGSYFIALLAIFVIEFIAGILALAFYTQAEFYAEDSLEDSLKEVYGLPGEEDTTAAWNYVQRWFSCCGLLGNTTKGALIYIDSMWYLSSNTRVPKSCCSERNWIISNLQLCQDRTSVDWYTFINNEGCFDAIYATSVQFSTIIAGVGITLSLVQLFGMAFSFCLFRRL